MFNKLLRIAIYKYIENSIYELYIHDQTIIDTLIFYGKTDDVAS